MGGSRRFTVLMILLGSIKAKAESQVWLRNHTLAVLEIETKVQSTKPWVEGSQWTRGASQVLPGEVVEVAAFSRRRRHVNREGAHIVARIHPENVKDGLELRTTVRPSFCGTRLESGMGGMSAAEMQWVAGGRRMSIVRAQASRPLGGFPFCQGGDERVEYLVESLDDLPPAPVPSPDGLNVMTYNIWYLVGKPRQSERWMGIPAVVSGNDVVVFTEAFKGKYRGLIADKIRKEYPYMTTVIDGGGSWINGGVFVASKWPFEGLERTASGLYQADQYIFEGSECSGEDCFAAKGVQHVPIRKNGRTFHIFATHLQSTDPLLRSASRASNRMILQTARVGAWIKSKQISADEAVLIAGDLNFNANLPAIRSRSGATQHHDDGTGW
jgi:endonuclease/exonuclease/phosphatase family metal-dependent hydrolase